MAMEHKAFVFEYESFNRELAPSLSTALENDDVRALREFIERNLSALSDPYEGESLGASWEEMIETPDAHQYGEFALTKFYNPEENIGIGSDWTRIQPILERDGTDGAFLLGTPFGPPGKPFDPGKMGSYFQSPETVARNAGLVRELYGRPLLLEIVPAIEDMFSLAEGSGKGLYVTF